MAGIAIVIVALSAFLPWVSILGISVVGIQGDGVITLGCAVVGAVMLALGTNLFGSARIPTIAKNIVSILGASVTTLVGLGDMNGFAAIGLYLTLLAGVAWLVAAIWDASAGQRQ
jgi:hypothetical protein